MSRFRVAFRFRFQFLLFLTFGLLPIWLLFILWSIVDLIVALVRRKVAACSMRASSTYLLGIDTLDFTAEQFDESWGSQGMNQRNIYVVNMSG